MPNDVRTGSLLIFDGDCGFCTSVARWSARRFRHGEETEAWQLLDPKVLDQHELTLREVKDAAWWVDDSGLRERGHRAVGRALGAQGKHWRVVSWIVLNPPTSWLAASLYLLVARWRHRLPGATPACRAAPNRGN